MRLLAAACALAFVDIATASGSSAAVGDLAPPTRARVDHVDAPLPLDARPVTPLASRVGDDTSPGDAPPWGKKLHKNCQPREVEPDQRCAYVTQTPSCAKDDHFVHYLRLHYCVMARAPVASALAQLSLALFFCFVLANVAERFFCPALSNVSAALRLPQDVAGATLLSFGNGAPDVFAQFESVSKANADTVSLGIGAALGAGFFVCGCVFPVVALISPTPGDDDDEAEAEAASASGGRPDGADEREPFVERYPWSRFAEWTRRGGIKTRTGPFARDSSFYVVAVASVFYVFRGGDVTFTQAAALSTLYGVYAIAVAAPGRIAARFRARESETSPSRNARDAAPSAGEELDDPLLRGVDRGDRGDPNDGGEDGTSGGTSGGTPSRHPGVPSRRASRRRRDSAPPDSDEEMELAPHLEAMLDCADACAWGTRETIRAAFHWCVRAPTLAVLRATMPELGKHAPRGFVARASHAALPVAAPVFFAVSTRIVPREVSVAGAVFGAMCGASGSAATYAAWPSVLGPRADPAAKATATAVLTVVAFAQAIVWMDATASELVALFSSVGRISGLSESVLGATVFAWGISVGDLASDAAVARSGRPTMAIAACFGGPMFNLLVGLATGLVAATASRGTVQGVRLENEIIVLATCQVVYLAYLVVGVPLIHRGFVGRRVALAMLLFYWLSQALVVLTSAGIIFPEPWMRVGISSRPRA